MADGNGSTGGITALGLLGVVFVTLKVLGKIDWPWLWVLAPFWGGLALVLGIFALAAVGAAVVTLFQFTFTRRGRR